MKIIKEEIFIAHIISIHTYVRIFEVRPNITTWKKMKISVVCSFFFEEF